MGDFIEGAESWEESCSDSGVGDGQTEQDSVESVDYVPWDSMAGADPRKDLARSNFRRKMERSRTGGKDKDCGKGS